jgi:NTP pyrophosphatase (non-canonical NTP hydrolase)
MIELEPGAPLSSYQRYIQELEEMHGWLDVDLVHNCFLMGEEVGELFKAVRKLERIYDQAEATAPTREAARAHVAEEIVDVMNYLLAISNRLDLDLEASFREKNARNQERTWNG